MAPDAKIDTATVLRHRKAFARWLYVHLTGQDRRHLQRLYTHNAHLLGAQLWPVIHSYLLAHHGDVVSDSRKMLQLADMAKPHTWYPLARDMERYIVYHAGPTNSGKTYHALQVCTVLRASRR